MRCPSLLNTCGLSTGEAAGSREGTRASAALSRAGRSPANGAPRRAAHIEARNRPGLRQDNAEGAPQQPVEPRSLVRLLDMMPGVVDKVHVVDARRAGRHAR